MNLHQINIFENEQVHEQLIIVFTSLKAFSFVCSFSFGFVLFRLLLLFVQSVITERKCRVHIKNSHNIDRGNLDFYIFI